MCKVSPSNLGLVEMRWFDGLGWVPLIPLRSSLGRLRKGSSTLGLPVVHVHARRGDPENIHGQILGNV